MRGPRAGGGGLDRPMKQGDVFYQELPWVLVVQGVYADGKHIQVTWYKGGIEKWESPFRLIRYPPMMNSKPSSLAPGATCAGTCPR
jgi:hypothetical protein